MYDDFLMKLRNGTNASKGLTIDVRKAHNFPIYIFSKYLIGTGTIASNLPEESELRYCLGPIISPIVAVTQLFA